MTQLDLFPDRASEAPPATETAEAPPTPDFQLLAARRPSALACLAVPAHLGEALASFEDGASDHPRRVAFRSAFRRVGRATQLPLDKLPATAPQLRPLLANANPALVGIKPQNWKQVKSLALRGLRELGVDVTPSRSATPLSPEWQALLVATGDRRLQIGLSRLLRHLSDEGITPAQVNLAAFEDFRRALGERSLLKDASGAYRQAVRDWNKAARTAPGWPRLCVPAERDPRHFSFGWDEFPDTFRADVEAFLGAKADTDPLSDDYSRPTQASTTLGRRKGLRTLASALVLSGEIPIDRLTSLGVLTTLKNARAALRYLRDERSDGKVTEGQINLAWLLRTVAKHWLKDEARTAELKTLIANLTKHVRADGGRGMTAKNRERLRQFYLPQNVDALISLPERVLKARRKRDPTYRDSVRVMRALMVGILTFVPIRSRNLTELELGTHLIDIGKGSKRMVRLHLPREITKTYRDYNAPLPTHLYPLLDCWLGEHRSRVSAAPSAYLFPNPGGALRSRDSLATKLTDFMAVETGLKVNPHLFRHIAAKLYLDHDPAGIEIVRQLLGHTSIETTLAFYAELQTDPAFKRMEAALLTVGYPLSRASAAVTKKGRRA